MSNDEHACILKLCHHNLETNVRKCVIKTFNGYLDSYNEQLQDFKKSERVKKSMKRFQQKLKFIALDEDCEDLKEDFFNLLCTEIDYLETLLCQVTKLKLQLLSKVRTTSVSDLDMKIPDKSHFANEILQRNAYTFFHSVPLYHQFYQTRNLLQIKDMIDSVTQEVMDNLTTKSYSVFFSKPIEAHVMYQKKMDDIMKKSGCDEPSRAIPKEVEEKYEEEVKSKHSEEKQTQEKRESKAPEYKTVYVDEEIPLEEEAKESEENKEGEKKDKKSEKLTLFLKKLKEEDDAKSTNSDELEETLIENAKEGKD